MSEKDRLPKSTKSGWGVHEIANALGIFKAREFKVDQDDVESGRRILKNFLDNIDQPNSNIEGQGALSDSEMKGFIESALDQEWTSISLKGLYKEFIKLREKVNQ